ncbi:MAG TPA: hypothetical protein VJW20_16865 [Candidatus Angelobacter sp.]|nr:hypothetical protein [Candidatus Angelobacter sp.]
MTTYYPSTVTRQRVEAAIRQNKKVLWIVDNLRALFSNPTISIPVGAMVAPTDGGAAFAPDVLVQGGVDGFALAARNAGVYTGSGLSSEFEDWNAAGLFLSNAKFIRATTYYG